MKKMRFLLAFLLTVVLMCSVALLASCGDDAESEPPVSQPVKLTAPTVTLTDDTATWAEDACADKFEISINDEFSYVEKSVTNKKFEDGQTFKVRAVGDGVHYTTSDWSNSVTYTKPIPTYTVTWKNGDTVLETDTDVPYGTVPSYDGSQPVKEETAQYTYAFKEWTPTIAPVVSDVTYEAVFNATVKEYTITFYSEDGETELAKVRVPYGEAATYTGETPEKNATEQHTFYFDKWVTAIGGNEQDHLANVICDRNVYASFGTVTRSVDVYFAVNHEEYGTVSVDVLGHIPYGSSISVVGNTVSIGTQQIIATATAATAQYTYTFVGWDAVQTVGHGTVITANFTRTLNTYTVTWKNGQTVLETDNDVPYGTVPTYNGEVPTTPAELPAGYVFCGWTPVVAGVTGNVSYYAQFTDGTDKHTVMFYDADGTTVLGVAVVENGTTAAYPGVLPVKESSLQTAFSFDKWVTAAGGTTEADLSNVTSDLAVYASYTESAREYTVTFCDYDGIVLETQIVAYGAAATEPEIPERDEHRFDGWNKSFDQITGDLIVTATYQLQVYVEFLDYDGSIIYVEYVDFGGDLVNMPEDPTRIGYAFTGWSKTVFTDLTQSMEVHAQYVRTYSVKFVDYDGTELDRQTVIVGEAAEAPEDPTREGYTFTGWDKAFDEITAHMTVVATYEINSYTVTFVGAEGKEISVVEGIRHGSSVQAPEVAENWFNWSTQKGYRFTGWSAELDSVTADMTVTALYDEEITEPIVITRPVSVSKGTESVNVNVYICYSGVLYGVSLDVSFDNQLQLGGKATAAVKDTFGTADKDYTSQLTDQGEYELRWTDGEGVSSEKPITVLTFTFHPSEFQDAGVYLVSILESTYIIDEELTKVTPVIISGSVTIEE